MTGPGTRQGSLRGKLIFSIAGILGALLLLIFATVTWHSRERIRADLSENAVAVTRAFSVYVLDSMILSQIEPDPRGHALDNYVAHFLDNNPQLRSVTVFGPEGEIFANAGMRSGAREGSSPVPLDAQRIGDSVTRTYESFDHGWVLEATMPLRTGSKVWGYLQISRDAEKARREISRVFWILALTTLLAVIVVNSVTRLLVRRLIHSLTTLTQEMGRLDLDSVSSLEVTVSGGDDEVGRLTHTFRNVVERMATSRDELIQAQKQVARAEKLASIGRLASGVAHEINNPLGGIRNCLHTIQTEVDDREQTLEFAQLAGEGLDHIETVVRKLMGFAHQHSRREENVSVEAQVRRVLDLLAYKLRGLKLELDLDPELAAIHADAIQLQEVLMNLLINACDAVGERGRIKIRTFSPEPGQIALSIADDGPGIPNELIPNIFDPFFTTKEPGVGTGLGLSVVIDIVEAHGGQIDVRSGDGEGAVFTVRLPVRLPVLGPGPGTSDSP